MGFKKGKVREQKRRLLSERDRELECVAQLNGEYSEEGWRGRAYSRIDRRRISRTYQGREMP